MPRAPRRDEVDISMGELWRRYHAWVDGRYSDDEVRRLFAGTAEAFYGI